MTKRRRYLKRNVLIHTNPKYMSYKKITNVDQLRSFISNLIETNDIFSRALHDMGERLNLFDPDWKGTEDDLIQKYINKAINEIYVGGKIRKMIEKGEI